MKFLKIVILLSISFLVEIGADLTTYYLDTDLCNRTMDMDYYKRIDVHSFRLKLSNLRSTPHNLGCQLQIWVKAKSEKIMFYFLGFSIFRDPNCGVDWLELHDGDSLFSPFVFGTQTKLCGTPARTKGLFTTESNVLTLFFKSGPEENFKGFDMVITRFRYDEQCRPDDEYACDNCRCIDKSLVCNGYNPCGDRSDCNTSVPEGFRTATIVLCLTLCLTIAGLTYFIVKKIRAMCTQGNASEGERLVNQ